jgi:hypothetical protein
MCLSVKGSNPLGDSAQYQYWPTAARSANEFKNQQQQSVLAGESLDTHEFKLYVS